MPKDNLKLFAIKYPKSAPIKNSVVDGLVSDILYPSLFIVVVSLFGVYGLLIAFIFLIANICNYEILGKPYFFPIAPFDLNYIKETIFKMKNNKRSKLLSNNTYKGDTPWKR